MPAFAIVDQVRLTGSAAKSCSFVRTRQGTERICEPVELRLEDAGLPSLQQRAVPVVFQDTPAPFDEVVFAVVRRVVRQFQRQSVLVREFD